MKCDAKVCRRTCVSCSAPCCTHGTESSDLDILIDPTPETTLFDIGAIMNDLRKLLGARVDVLTPNALPDSFRAKVLAEARPVWRWHRPNDLHGYLFKCPT